MTREEIMAMEPGRELDRLVAIKVMGYEPSKMEPKLVRKGAVAFLPEPYSWNISAAWEVEEMMSDDMGKYVKALCDVVGTPRDGTRLFASDDWRLIHASPSDRCKAALLAVLGEEEA